MMRFALALGLGGALAVAGAALAENAKPDVDNCLRTSSINDFKVVDDHTLILTEGVSHDFKVTVVQNTRRLKHVNVLKAESIGSSCLGAGDRLEAVDHMIGSHDVFTVTAVEYIPNDEDAETTGQ